jgi:hypothetical protein
MTDMMELIVTFQNSANRPKSDCTVFLTAAKINAARRRKCYSNKCTKEAVIQVAAFCSEFASWRSG